MRKDSCKLKFIFKFEIVLRNNLKRKPFLFFKLLLLRKKFSAISVSLSLSRCTFYSLVLALDC